jgi:hypothetical protein
MTLWFQRAGGLDSEIMRQAAKKSGVSWSYQTIKHTQRGIGYSDGNESDATAVKDELEKLLGYRPIEIDEPTVKSDQPRDKI